MGVATVKPTKHSSYNIHKHLNSSMNNSTSFTCLYSHFSFVHNQFQTITGLHKNNAYIFSKLPSLL